MMNRKTIEEAAFKLFREKGYEAVKVQDICDECQITKPTFYHYVASKDDLLVSYYNAAVNALEERITLAQDEDPLTQLSGAYRVLIDQSEKIGPELLGRILIINLQKNSGSFDKRATISQTMAELIAKAQEKHAILNISDPHELYRASAYLFQGYELMWCVNQGKSDWRFGFMSSLEALLLPRY